MSKKPIIKPPRLNRADTIGIVAPASSFDIDNFKEGVKQIRRLGYKVKYQRSMFNKCWSQPGHNKQRAAQINRMFSDRDVKAIFCAKAGYGSVDILPFLDKKIIRNNPKIFVGYSDITILLLYLQRIANMVVFHGPVVSGEIHSNMNKETLDYLLKVLTKAEPLGRVELGPLHSFKQGRACGRLVGGNLSLVAQSIGSCYRISTDDAVLFLEDVDEDLDAVEGYLRRLRKAGKFRKVKGLILGRMIDCFQTRENLKILVNKTFRRYDIPIIFGLASGHKEKEGQPNVTLPFGVNVCIDTRDLGLGITEPAVS